jgi:hypothetical protein
VKSNDGGAPAAALHPGSGKELGVNSLWADRYAPSRSSEILGNSDSVAKLARWLSCWEGTFNGGGAGKGLGGPNGPWKAALLSGPPGIGEDVTKIFCARRQCNWLRCSIVYDNLSLVVI